MIDKPILLIKPIDNGVFPLQISAIVNAKLRYFSIKMLPYSPLLLIKWGSSQVHFFLFCNEPIWLAHHLTKLKLWRLPKIKGYILKYRVPPLWSTYIGERRTTFAKAYGIIVKCYGKHIGENIENLMGTHYELKRNMVRTHWEPENNEKISFPSPNSKWKKWVSHSLHEISLPKRVCHHFWTGPSQRTTHLFCSI